MVGNRFSYSPISVCTPAEGLPERGNDGRCFGAAWLGRSLIKGRTLPGNMVSDGTQVPHQSKGDTCGTSGSQEHDETGGTCPPVPGQPDGRVLHQPDGGYQVQATLYGSHSTLGDSTGQTRMGEGCLGAEGEKPVVRYAVQNTDEHMGVLTVPKIGDISVGPLVHTSGGCLREQEMSCAPSILQLVSRSGGTGKGCVFPQEVASKDLLLSSCSFDPNDTVQDCVGRLVGYSGDTRMADSPVVGSADTNVTGGSYPTGVLQGDPDPGAGTGSALPPPIGRMPSQETGKNSFLTDQMMTILPSQGEGDFSLLTEHARDLLQNDIRYGTHKIYRSRFKIFSDFCVKGGYDPTSCPVEIVANFLASLKKDRSQVWHHMWL